MSGGDYNYWFDDYYYPDNDTVDYAYDFDCNETAQIREDSAENVFSILFISLALVLNASVNALEIYSHSKKTSKERTFIRRLLFSVIVFNLLFCLLMTMIDYAETNGVWTLGEAACRLKFAGAHICYHVITILYLSANVSQLLMQSTLSDKLQRMMAPVKRILMILFPIMVFNICVLINIPLFKFTQYSVCRNCILDFPIATADICSWVKGMLGMSSCNKILGYLDNEDSKTDSLSFFDDISPSTFNDSNSSSSFTSVETYQCRHDLSHYHAVWIYVNFVFFYVIPLLVFLVFYHAFSNQIILPDLSNKTEDDIQNISSLRILFLCQLVLFLSWLPWHVTQITKISGMNLDLESCLRLDVSVNIVTFIFAVLSPIIYIILTKDIRETYVKFLRWVQGITPG